MRKNWDGSAMPSVLKGFAMIGQPLEKDEFEKAFGYEMPEVNLTEDEKRRAALSAVNNELKPVQPINAVETYDPKDKPENPFGQKFLVSDGERQKESTDEQQSPPLEIEIRGVGNSTGEETPTETGQDRKDIQQTDDPYTSKTLSILEKMNREQNRGQTYGTLRDAQQDNGGNAIKNYDDTAGFTANGTPAQTRENGSLNYWNRIGQNENHDNIAAQPDPNGKERNALEETRRNIAYLTERLERFLGDGTAKIAGINRQQQETGNDNHLLNWANEVAKGENLQNPITHPQQDYQPGYQAILGHEANRKLAEAKAEPIETEVNGKQKYQVVADAFTNEYITEMGKLGLSIVSLANHALDSAINGGKPINPQLRESVDNDMMGLIRKSDAYLKNSMSIEKLQKGIVAGDDAKTVENLSQFGYELLGEKAPQVVAGAAGGSLLAGAGLAGGASTIVKGVKDFTVNLAEANARIIRETGNHDWEMAFKMASLSTVGGRAIDGQMEKLKGSGGKNGVFIKLLGDALKKRFNDFVKDWVLRESQRDKASDND